MKLLKNSIYIYKTDIKRILKNPLTLVIIIGLMFIPSMYAWFNIQALWDPYSNASNLPIGVYSADIGAKVNGQYINIGTSISDILEDDENLDWQIDENKAELTQHVKDGTYYASIYLPPDFSQKLTSIIDGTFEKPTIEYTVNEKINSISPKMADTGAAGLVLGITQGFNKVVSQVTLETFKNLGMEINENIPLFNSMFYKIDALDQKADNFDSFLNDINSLNSKIDNYSGTLNNINNSDILIKMDNLQAHIHNLNENIPKLLLYQSKISNIAQKTDSLNDFKNKINNIDNRVSNIYSNIDSINIRLNDINSKINTLNTILDRLQNNGESLSAILEDLQITTSDIENFVDDILYTLKSGLNLLEIILINISSISNNLNAFLTNNTLSPADITNIINLLTNLDANLSSINNLIQNILNILIPINIISGGTFNSTISTLQGVQTKISTLQTNINYIITNINTLSVQNIIDALTNIQNEANDIINLINNLDITSLSQDLEKLFNSVENGIISGNLFIENLNYDTLASIQDSLENLTAFATSSISKLQTKLPNIKEDLDKLNIFLQNNTDKLILSINKANDFWQNNLPNIGVLISNIDEFMYTNWPSIRTNLSNSLDLVNKNLPKVYEALDATEDFSNNTWPKIRDFIHSTNETTTKIKNNESLQNTVNHLLVDVQKGSDFIASPVQVKTVKMYPVKNYGSASAPFYTVLCLWVGAVLLTSILSTHFYNDSKKKISNREVYLGRLYTFLFIAIIQALIVAFGDVYLLKISMISPIWFIVFTTIIAISFNCIVYTLANLFGNVGKALAVVGLVLSISAGGGNFPIEVSGNFFQFINPLLPFTYGVNLLREPIGGIYLPTVYTSLFVLITYTILFLLLGLFGARYINPILRKLQKKSSESHILH